MFKSIDVHLFQNHGCIQIHDNQTVIDLEELTHSSDKLLFKLLITSFISGFLFLKKAKQHFSPYLNLESF